MRAAGKKAARKPRSSRGIQSIEVGHRLLAALIATGKPLALRELAAAADLAPAQAHAYLASFRRVGLVEQDPAGGHYALGPFAMRLGMARIRSSARLAEASRATVTLAQRLGLTACLTVWGPQAPTVVQLQDGGEPLDLNIREGTGFSVTGTATGRLFGALMSSSAVKARIDAELSGHVISQGGPASRTALKVDFADIRARGLSTTRGRPLPGINAVAAPVLDENGALIAAVTLIGTPKNLPLKTNDRAAALLRAEAGRISNGQVSAPDASPPVGTRRILAVPPTHVPDEVRGVQSIEVGTRFLAALVEAGRPMMLRDLAALADLPAAGSHAYLASYRNCGMVEQEEAAGLYRVGPAALDLAIVRMRTVEPLAMAREAIRTLAGETGLTVALAVWGSSGPTVIDVAEGADQLHIATKPGTVYSVIGTATGRVFAAFLPERIARAAIAAEIGARARQERTGEKLDRALRLVRARGLAGIDTPPIPGIGALSAPVFDHVGQVHMAVTIIGPAGIVGGARDDIVATALLRITGSLSARLGFDGTGLVS